MDEFRLAVRRLSKQAGASIASIVTLACAIGAATATWSLISALLLHPLPVTRAGELFVVGARYTGERGGAPFSDALTYPAYPSIRSTGVFEGLAAGGMQSLLVGAGDLPQTRTVFFASYDYFETLGVRPALGRTFSRDEDRRGAPLVALLSDRAWRRWFGADRQIIGRQISVSGRTADVIGVTPPGFRGLTLAKAPDLYLPLETIGDVGSPMMNFFADPQHGSSPTAWVTTVGRLGTGFSAAQAVSQLESRQAETGSRDRRSFALTGVEIAAIPAAARAGMTQFTRLLGATVGLLLLAGCLTVGMLLLIRTEARRDEFAMCLALGATRARLARGIVIEGALLSLTGAVLAVPIAGWLFSAVRVFQLPGGVDIDLLELSIDARVFVAAVGGACAATLLIALVAGVSGFSANIAETLRSRAGVTPRISRRRTRAALVMAQVAVAVVLAVGAGLFARSLIASLELNPGFDTSHIVTGGINLAQYGYTPVRATAFFAELQQRLSGNPAIRDVSLASNQGGMGGFMQVDGVARQFPSFVAFNAIDDRYFAAMGLRIVKGRAFSPDDREHAPLTAIVSESFGRQLSTDAGPLGRKITMPFSRKGEPKPVVEVVGVVPDVITSVSVLEPLVLYLPLAQQAPGTAATIVLRSASDASSAVQEATRAIKQLDPALTPSPMLTIDERLAQQMSPQRFGALVLGALGFIAVLLTLLGTYVLAESMTAIRMREMGIRAALGATGRQLRAIVLTETVRLVGSGLALGGLLALMGAKTIRAFLFQVAPLDPTTLALVALLILALALGVSLRPARRAARVDLARVLREE